MELAPVRIVVHEFAITSVDGDSAEFRATVSAGGYIRSLAHDLGQQMGCGAHLASLRRVAAGPFCADAALSLEELATLAEAGELERHLPHPRTLLPEFPSTTADAHTAAACEMARCATWQTFPRPRASRYSRAGTS